MITAYYLLLTAYCSLLTAHCLLLTGHCLYRFRDSTSSSRVSLVVMMRELAWKSRW